MSIGRSAGLSCRSMLFVPGNQDRLIQSATRSEADVVVLDCEDSVPPDLKKETLRSLRHRAELFDTGALVRLNPLDPELVAEDLGALSHPSISGLVIPDVQTVAQLRDVDNRLRSVEEDRESRLATYLLIESALGVRNCYDLATQDRPITGAIFGGGYGGDLCADLQCSPSRSGIELLYARSKVLLDLRAAGVPDVLDGVWFDLQDQEGLEEDSRLSRRCGYSGRCVVHPSQIGPVNALYAPSERQRAWAHGVLQAMSEGAELGIGAIRFEGQLVDAATVRIAEQILKDERSDRD